MRWSSFMLVLVLVPPRAATGHERISTDVTYDREVVRILHDRCVGCHGAADKVPLATYAQARPWAKAIRDEVESGRMPPWPPERGVGDLVDDRALTPRAAEILIAWVEGGAPEGDARDLVGANKAKPAAATTPNARRLRVVGAQVLASAVLVHAVKPLAPSLSRIEVRAQLPDGSQRPLISIPQFDERYPFEYALRAPLMLPARTRLVVFGPKSGSAELTVTDVPATRSPRTAP